MLLKVIFINILIQLPVLLLSQEVKYQAIWYVKLDVNEDLSDINNNTKYTHYFGMIYFFNKEEYDKFYPGDIPNEDYLLLIKRTVTDTSETQYTKAKDDVNLYNNYKQFIPSINWLSSKGIGVLQHISEENCIIYFKVNYYYERELAMARYQELLLQNSSKYYWVFKIINNFDNSMQIKYNNPTCNFKYGIFTCSKNVVNYITFLLNSTTQNFIFNDFTNDYFNEFVDINENLIDSEVNVKCDDITSTVCYNSVNKLDKRSYYLIPKGFKDNCITFNARNLSLLAMCGLNTKPNILNVDVYNSKPDFFFLTNCIKNNRPYMLLTNIIPDSD
jgi:hypothetical protein